MRDFDPIDLELEATHDARGPAGHAPAASIELFDDFEQERLLAQAYSSLFDEEVSVKIGRYRIEKRLGAGGMGEVYLATDDELGRQVAVKRVLTNDGGAHEQERLRREAQALARLNHANVISVYEIGEHDEQLFVAMQYVPGQTLAEYLAAGRQPWREVLTRFIAAGRGLAAAHRAGLVHRDFKPENVLLGETSEVRVADFGLVLSAGHLVALSDTEDRKAHIRTPRLSTAGAIMGTVRYMPFEQVRGGEVDARSDQFSFCVALYEALWGVPPFALDSALSRFEALERGIPTTPPRGVVPAGLWRAIRRGLDYDPQRRWPDMDALLHALEEVPQRRRLGVWLGVGALALGLGAGIQFMRPIENPCASIERELSGTWDTQLRADLAARFEQSENLHLKSSGEPVLTGLDRWAEAWVDEREGVCHASQTQSLSPELERLRGACLTRHQLQAGDLVELLTTASEAELAHAVGAVNELPAPSSCATELALLGVEVPSPLLTDEVELVRASLARNRELRLLGRVDEALGLAAQLLETAEQLAYPPLLAEAHAELARAEIDGGSLDRGIDQLDIAIDIAEAHRHDTLAAELWTELALRLLGSMRNFDAGASALRRAEVAGKRSPSPSPRAAAKRAFARSRLAASRGDAVGGERALREALELIQAEGRQDRPSYLSSLALLVDKRDEELGLRLHREALEAAQAVHGPTHPQTATLAFKLAEALRARGQEDEATPLLARAVEIWTQVHDKPHRNLARVEQLMAQDALNRGDLDEAEIHALRLVDIQAQILPPGHSERGEPELLLALIHSLRGQRDRALVRARAAVTIWSPSLPPSHENLNRARIELAQNLLASGEELERAATEYSLVIEHGPASLADQAALGLVELELERGHPEAAITALEHFDRTLAAQHRDAGSSRFTRALLWTLAAHRAHDPGLTRIHAEELAGIEAPFHPDQVDAWLTELEVSPAERDQLGL